MNFLPLAARELRVALRSPRRLWTRMITGGGSIAFSIWALLAWSNWNTGSALGSSLLGALSAIALVAALVSGPLLTSDSISRERREGTLGLLFLTPLNGRDVILGKLTARGIAPFHMLLGVVPALAICVIVGGVSSGEFWRMLLCLGNTLFFSLSIALLASTLVVKRPIAHALALGGILIFALLLPWVSHVLALSGKKTFPVWMINLFSPTAAYLLALDKSYAGAPGRFWTFLTTSHFAAWASLAIASGRVRKGTEKAPSTKARIKRGDPIPSGRFANPPTPRRIPNHLTADPVSWLWGRPNRRSKTIWMLPVSGLGLWILFGMDAFGAGLPALSFCAWTGLHVCLCLWMVLDVTDRFGGEHRGGIFEQILSSPLTSPEIGCGLARGISHRYAAPCCAMAGFDIWLASISWAEGKNFSAGLSAGLAAAALIGWRGLVWTSLWQALFTADTFLASIRTLWRIMLLPWIWFGIAALCFRNSAFGEFVVLWLVLAAANAAAFVSHSKAGFLEHFRTLAVRPFGQKPPSTQSAWSPINWDIEPATPTPSSNLPQPDPIPGTPQSQIEREFP